jgi:ubiquinone/menaquinone biosynthesis C-methylase UbiE
MMPGAIEKLIMMDTSYDMVKVCKDAEKDVHNENIETSFIVGDEEFLPIKERCACTLKFPFIVSSGITIRTLYLWFEAL